MISITETGALAECCAAWAHEPFVCLDTEFMREGTYWPRLCLVQVSPPSGEGAVIDPLVEGLDLQPLLDLLAAPDVTKVFHAARQDIEIFYQLAGAVPGPLFDTQVAAMVCGFGDSVGYETLVKSLAGANLDKTSRFTDWSRRPLTERQLEYALADVTHLPEIYLKLTERLESTGRGDWVTSEMATLLDPEIYRYAPERAWLRLKTRNTNPRFLALLRDLAAWRERACADRNLPRARLVRDEALLEIAAHKPSSAKELAHTRGLSESFASGRLGQAILEVIANARDAPVEDLPKLPRPASRPRGVGPIVDLLKVLLKARCEEADVAQKLIANTADLESLAAEDSPDIPALHGWRHEIFGADAIKLKRGEVALSLRKGKIRLVPVANGTA